MEFLTVKNWETFQHYGKRNPPWIKVHRALVDDYFFSKLPDAAKGHLIMLWLFASQNNGRIPYDIDHLQTKLSCKDINLELLIESGFLVRTTMLASVTSATR